MKAFKKICATPGALLLVGGAVMAVVTTSFVWGGAAMAGLLLTIVVGDRDGLTVDYSNSNSGYFS